MRTGEDSSCTKNPTNSEKHQLFINFLNICRMFVTIIKQLKHEHFSSVIKNAAQERFKMKCNIDFGVHCT